MAQNITLWGAGYTQVPAVKLPKTGGGTASFTDVTDTTATAGDVASGKYFYTAAGVKTQGTSSGGGSDVFLVTVSYNQQDDMWEPDCTYAQVSAAYTAGKEITVQTDSDEGVSDGVWIAEYNNQLLYVVYDWHWDESLGLTGSRGRMHILSSSGLEVDEEWFNYEPSGTLNVTQSGTIDVARYASASVPAGTAGTPSASKGAVSNHSVSVTPSVTNTAGYISGGTKTGTAVSVSASELVSGNLAITQNGTGIDVTNYATVSVDVAGSAGMQIATATATPLSAGNSITFTNLGGQPTSFAIVSAADLATGAAPYKAAAVVYDGTSLHGQIVTNTNNAQASYSTAFTQSYSNGTLTVSGTGANFQANQYKLVYTHGGNSANLDTAETQVGSGATSVSFTGLTEEPDYFSVIFKSDFGTSSGYQRVMAVVHDGNSTYGMAMGSGAVASTTDWSYAYSNGTLTVSSQGTNAGGYFHQPGYYQLTYGIGGEVEPVQIDVEPLSVTQNGTYTAPAGTAYSPVTVNVSGGGGMNVQAYTGTSTRTANSYGATDVTLTVAKSGTYTVSWTAWRSSSSGTMGTNLHVNNTTGTNQQTFTSTYGQCITLTNQRYNQGDELTLYATSGSTTRSIIVANLVIVQTA